MPDGYDSVAAEAAEFFGGPDGIRQIVRNAVNPACADAGLSPEKLAEMVGLPKPDVVKALNGSPKFLTERMALRLMALLGISLDDVLPGACLLKADLNDWNDKRIAMRNGCIATAGSANDDVEINAKLFIRLQAMSTLD
ncbi:MAG: hypothetical protein WBD75_05890 [Phycisphaerae bacterium]